jgi:L-asparagine transporter-like permease
MILIFEVLLFIIGLWALIAGKLPVKLNKILFGKHATELSSNKTRLIGLLFISPFILAFFVGLIFGIFFDQDNLIFLSVFEFLYLLFIVFVAAFMVKKEKQKKDAASETIELEAQDTLSSLEDQD